MKNQELYQCPYNTAIKCDLKNDCLSCETFGEYLNKKKQEPGVVASWYKRKVQRKEI